MILVKCEFITGNLMVKVIIYTFNISILSPVTQEAFFLVHFFLTNFIKREIVFEKLRTLISVEFRLSIKNGWNGRVTHSLSGI
jgi:hypothetical protein